MKDENTAKKPTARAAKRRKSAAAVPKGHQNWPAQTVEMREIGDLKLNDHNPREHTLDQIEQISASMERFGWTIPVLVDEENVIIAGHGRVRAARLKGWRQAPVMVARGWTSEQKRAYLMADNQIAANSSWDRKMVQGELRSLMAADFDVALIGFSEAELSKLMIDPKKASTDQPEEFTVQVCPTCGRAKRKVEE